MNEAARTTDPLRKHAVLVVEDNPADADYIVQLLAEPGRLQFDATVAETIAQAVEVLRDKSIDVTLLDLHLPDKSGVEAVLALRDESADTPIVVVTGADNERLAYECVEAGAQDYLSKNELSASALRRALGYAMRRREAQIREIEQTISQYRALSRNHTEITAGLAGVGALRERSPTPFARIVLKYAVVLEDYLSHLIARKPKPREAMEIVVTQLGDAGAGPRDVIDVHVAALDGAVTGRTSQRAAALAVEGRLFALEIMGLMVDYYRTGFRRRPIPGEDQ